MTIGSRYEFQRRYLRNWDGVNEGATENFTVSFDSEEIRERFIKRRNTEKTTPWIITAWRPIIGGCDPAWRRV